MSLKEWPYKTLAQNDHRMLVESFHLDNVLAPPNWLNTLYVHLSISKTPYNSNNIKGFQVVRNQ